MINNSTQELQALDNELANLIENRDLLLDSINRMTKEDLRQVDQSLPQGRHSAELLRFFENLSGRSGLVLKNIDFTEKIEIKKEASAGQPKPGGIVSIPQPQSASPTKELPINFSLLGNYESFKAFLGGLERNTRIMDVRAINFSSAGTGGIFTILMQAKTYYQ